MVRKVGSGDARTAQVLSAFSAPTRTWFEAAFAAPTPARRVGRPGDTASLVAFLCSSEGGWVNGQLICSDGGLHV